MANASQGTTATWGTVTLGEVVSIAVDGVSSDTVEVTPRTSTSRFKYYRRADVDLGTVSVTLRGTAGMSATSVGLTAALSIGGLGVSWLFNEAVFQSLGWQASVGELQTYNVTFKIT